MPEPSAWPLVSVVVVNLDGVRHLEPCFQSLSALNYPADRVELILVDNGSKDDSVRFVQRHFPQVLVIQNNQNNGFAQANNQGVTAASGEYVALVNNDMRVHPDWLRELVTAARSAEDIAAVGGKILTWDGKGVDFETGVLNFHGMGFQPRDNTSQPDDRTSEVLFACGGSMLVNRQQFLDAGSFDESYFAYFEDVDLGWRFWLLGYRVLYNPRALTYHRGHATSARISMDKVGVLYERNSLFSVIKNYEADHLSQVLPAALLLLVRRTMVFGRIDKRHFRMPRSASSGPPPFQPLTEEQKSHASIKQQNLYQRWRAFADDFGFWQATKMSLRLVLLLGYRLLGLQRLGILLVSNHSLSHLVAADDLIDAMPALMEKRDHIQARRQRSDAEILPLFIDPFHPHPPLPEYAAVQDMLVRLFQIDKMFTPREQSG